MDNSTGEPLQWYGILGGDSPDAPIVQLAIQETKFLSDANVLRQSIKHSRAIYEYHKQALDLAQKILATRADLQAAKDRIEGNATSTTDSNSAQNEKPMKRDRVVGTAQLKNAQDKVQKLNKSLNWLYSRLSTHVHKETERMIAQKAMREGSTLQLAAAAEAKREEKAKRKKEKKLLCEDTKRNHEIKHKKQKQKLKQKLKGKEKDQAVDKDEGEAEADAEAEEAQNQEEVYLRYLVTEGSDSEWQYYELSGNRRFLQSERVLIAMLQRMKYIEAETENVSLQLASALKHAYRRYAVMYHPDRYLGANAATMFQRLAKAYSVLSTPEKRRQYNQTANHLLYILANEQQDEHEAHDATQKHGLNRKDAVRQQNLRITSGRPDMMRKPMVEAASSNRDGTTVLVRWDKPRVSHDSGIAVAVEMCIVGEEFQFVQVYKGKDSYCKIPNLRDENYSFRICAVNTVGAGPYSIQCDILISEGEVLDPWANQSAAGIADVIEKKRACTRRRRKGFRRESLLDEEKKMQIVLRAKKVKATRIFKAIKQADVNELESLLKELSEEEEGERRLILNWPNAKDESPLTVAVQAQFCEAVDLLLSYGLSVINFTSSDNQTGLTALHIAVTNSDIDTVNVLLKHATKTTEIDIILNLQDYEGNTPLHLAMDSASEIVHALVKTGKVDLDMDRNDLSSPTALHIAAINGDLEMVKYLVENGACLDLDYDDEADAERYSHQEISPVFAALMNDNSDIVYYLLEKARATDKAVFDKQKDSLVHLAVLSENLEMIRYLLSKEIGADANVKEEETGNTPLHSAYENCSEEVIDLLLQLGCSTEIANTAGLLPEDLRDSAGDEQQSSENAEGEMDAAEPEELIVEIEEVAAEDAIIDVIDEEEEVEPLELLMLPDEIRIRILGFLFPRDLCLVRQVCKDLHSFVEDPYIWKDLFLRTFPYGVTDVIAGWKVAFIAQLHDKNRCVVCCRTNGLLMCGSCRSTFYCTRQHQILDWHRHRDVCSYPWRARARQRQRERTAEEQRHKAALQLYHWVEATISTEEVPPPAGAVHGTSAPAPTLDLID